MFTVKIMSDNAVQLISYSRVWVIPFESEQFPDVIKAEIEEMRLQEVEDPEYLASQYFAKITDLDNDFTYMATIGEKVFVTDQSGKTVYKLEAPECHGFITSGEQMLKIAGVE